MRASLRLAKEPQDPAVDFSRLLNEHEVANPLDQLGLRAFTKVSRHPLHLLRVEAMATILGTVQVEDRLENWRPPRGFLLLRPRGRAHASRIELRPVVTHSGLEVSRV